jgi:small conductance mechanosensitive channel
VNETDIQDAVQEIYVKLGPLITSYGLEVLGAIVMLIVGLWLSGWAKRATNAGLGRVRRIDATLRSFFANLARYAVLILTVIAVLNQFGVQTASLIAVLGAAGLAIGLALQGTLSNVAAGVMLLLFRPLSVGQFVEAGGTMGTVKEVNLFFTEMATLDNLKVVVPNSAIWSNNITNYSEYPTRRIDIVMGIAYDASIDDAMAVLRAAYEGDDRVLADPAPAMFVTNLAASSVDITVRLWCNAADLWALKTDLNKRFKEALDAEGIEIPFPQMTLHMPEVIEA